MAKRVAIDIAGTFTDFVGLDEATGEVTLEKALTTPVNFAEGAIHTIGKSGVDPREIRQFVHGTTVVINALTECKGAKMALITTQGLRDVTKFGNNYAKFLDSHNQRQESSSTEKIRKTKLGGDRQRITVR